MKKIVVRLHKNGEISADTQGMEGMTCRPYMQQLLDALDLLLLEEPKWKDGNESVIFADDEDDEETSHRVLI